MEYLAKKLDEYGIPYQRPAGGHAIFVDAKKVLTHVPKNEFPAQTLTVELYLEAGIRGCEIGYILADRDPVTRENRFTGLDLLRLAIPPAGCGFPDYQIPYSHPALWQVHSCHDHSYHRK